MTKLWWAIAAASALLMAVSIMVLAWSDDGIVTERLWIGDTPATLMTPPGDGPHQVAIIAHGYAGSRQMMYPLQHALARDGLATLSFDFIGHGRHPDALSPDVTDPAGTTADLVDQTVTVAEAALSWPGIEGQPIFAGHSMATDVIVRAARRVPAEAIVALSMYSDDVTAAFPARLLMVSGQWEGRLRRAALERVRLVDPAADEGETAKSAGTERRAAVAPGVGHVGVLWSRTTLAEATSWVGAADPAAAPPNDGPWILALLASITVLGVAAGRALPAADPGPAPTGRKWIAVLAPILPAVAAGWILRLPIAGLGGFSGLAAFLIVWGGIQTALLGPGRMRPGAATAVFAIFAAAFALSLDTVAAAFVPTGSRLILWAVLAVAAIPVFVADARLAEAGPLGALAGRVAFLLSLLGLMAADPARLGLLFTVLPVTVLFWIVFGSLAAPARRRDGAAAAGLALALAYGYAIAASTPIFAA